MSEFLTAFAALAAIMTLLDSGDFLDSFFEESDLLPPRIERNIRAVVRLLAAFSLLRNKR